MTGGLIVDEWKTQKGKVKHVERKGRSKANRREKGRDNRGRRVVEHGREIPDSCYSGKRAASGGDADVHPAYISTLRPFPRIDSLACPFSK